MTENEINNNEYIIKIEDINLLFSTEDTNQQTEKIFDFINACIENRDFQFPTIEMQFTDDIKQKIKALEEVANDLKEHFKNHQQINNREINLKSNILDLIQDQIKN